MHNNQKGDYPVSDTYTKIKELGSNAEFTALRDQAMESLVVMGEGIDDLPGHVHRGFYVDPDDARGVFRTDADVDKYMSLINGAVNSEQA